MVFFLDADEKVYARYGGRDGISPDERQSLDGLRYTMNSVLAMHQQQEKEYAPRTEGSQTTRQIPGAAGVRRCFHCHNVREYLNDDLYRKGKWTREHAWRYPLPDNLGLVLDLHRGNVVGKVTPDSPAARAGLQPGDILQQLNDVPMHSFADAQFALDRAPVKGAIPVKWTRAGEAKTGELPLAKDWKRSDISWRPSMQHMVPVLPLSGQELTADEKKELGLSEKQLAFRQRDDLHSKAKAAGIQGGDIILGFDDRTLMGIDVDCFYYHVRRNYLSGDRVAVNLLRDGKRLSLPLTLP